ncbi:MAG: methyl-accepting chemotaxis protein [Pseudomonadota bacterium]
MKLHSKLIFSLIAGLAFVVIVAQFFQYINMSGDIADFTATNIDLLKKREEGFAKNMYISIARAVSGSLERGEMDKFNKLIKEQKNVEGLVEFSLYNKIGSVVYSSDPSAIGKLIPENERERLSTDPAMRLIWEKGAIVIYKPQEIAPDCIRCHTDWQLGGICGVIGFKFSTKALASVQTEAENTLSTIKHSALTTSLLSVAGIIIVLWFTMNFLLQGLISRPLKKTVEMLRNIAEGEGDLTRRLSVSTGDEVGEVAKWFNTLMDKLQHMIKLLFDDIANLNISSKQLQLISEEMTSKANLMNTQSQEAAVSTDQTTDSIRTMALTAESVSTQVNLVNSSSSEVSINLQSIGSSVTNVTEAVHSLAISIEQMYATLNEVSKNSARGAKVTSEASRKADSTFEIVTNLGEGAKEIGDVVALINGIASQTNLLALNACIEAAGAGEAGKGFAVVANEVKELARQTARATDDIRNKIETMQANTSNAVQAINSILKTIIEINQIMGTIAGSVEEQTITTNEIAKSVGVTASDATLASDNVQKVIQIEIDVSKRIDEVAKAAASIAKEASEASSSTGKVSENVATVNVAVKDTTRGVDQVKTQAKDLAKISEQLRTIIGQFKV